MNKTKIEWCDALLREHKVRTREGYILVWCPDYPAHKGKGYVYEHRLVMAITLGRVLDSDEVVHHINGDRSDNRVENLLLTENGKHIAGHMREIPVEILRMRAKPLAAAARARRLPRVRVECSCGCGGLIESRDCKGRPRYFVHGHNQRGRNWRWSNE